MDFIVGLILKLFVVIGLVVVIIFVMPTHIHSRWEDEQYLSMVFFIFAELFFVITFIPLCMLLFTGKAAFFEAMWNIIF